MSQLTAIGNALRFVEEHLRQEIAVADMAEAAGYSLYHFSRTFNGLVHHTPYDYLIRRRLSESARDLIETDRLIIDVALDYRFNNPETYSRAFKRMFEMQPSQWKQRAQLDGRLLMTPLTQKHLLHINKGDSLRPALVEKSAFLVAGVMTLMEPGQEVAPRLWDLLRTELARADELRSEGEWYGLTWYPEDWVERGKLYMACAAIDAADATSAALVTKHVPPARYASFNHNGRRADLKLTRDYIYQIWLPKSNEGLACALEIEYYGKTLDAIQADGESEILIPIKKKGESYA